MTIYKQIKLTLLTFLFVFAGLLTHIQIINAQTAKSPVDEKKFRQAEILLIRRYYAWVIHDMSEILKTEPENTDALILRANAYFSLYNYYSSTKKEKAQELLEKLKSDWGTASGIAEKILKANPNQAEALNVRGSLEEMNKYRAEAVTDFTQAIKLKPGLVKAYMNRAEIFYYQNEYDKAFADYTTVIGLDPNYTLAYLQRGKIYSYPKKDYDAAIKDYTKAISLSPDLDVAYDYRGYAYKDKEDFNAAIADLTKAIELDPRNSTNWFDRGNIYDFMKNRELHDADYQQGVKIRILYENTELDDYEGQMRDLADAKNRERQRREELAAAQAKEKADREKVEQAERARQNAAKNVQSGTSENDKRIENLILSALSDLKYSADNVTKFYTAQMVGGRCGPVNEARRLLRSANAQIDQADQLDISNKYSSYIREAREKAASIRDSIQRTTCG